MVYNPMLFKHMLQLLRSCCWLCGSFSASRLSQVLFVRQMNLLDRGLVVDSLNLGLYLEHLRVRVCVIVFFLELPCLYANLIVMDI